MNNLKDDMIETILAGGNTREKFLLRQKQFLQLIRRNSFLNKGACNSIYKRINERKRLSHDQIHYMFEVLDQWNNIFFKNFIAIVEKYPVLKTLSMFQTILSGVVLSEDQQKWVIVFGDQYLRHKKVFEKAQKYEDINLYYALIENKFLDRDSFNTLMLTVTVKSLSERLENHQLILSRFLNEKISYGNKNLYYALLKTVKAGKAITHRKFSTIKKWVNASKGKTTKIKNVKYNRNKTTNNKSVRSV